MSNRTILEVLHRNLFGLVLVLAVFIIIGKAVSLGQGMHENFAKMGNDDIMRLTVVRDLIAGQSWFDTTQYRLLPPDGLSLHWSRYIDAGIAVIILSLSVFMPMDMAEQLAVTIWPTLIMLVTLGVVGFGTRRIFGTIPAVFAILCLVIWPLTADIHSSAGNLDHHNVQLLLTFVLVFAVIWPERRKAAGIAGGLVAAFSLAIGLESLLIIVVAGLILVVRVAMGQPARRLVSFCLALGFGSILFWLGQALPATRFAPVCDQLAPPILSLVWVAVIASIMPLALGARTSGWVKLGATVALTIVGLVVIWPLFGPCLTGPYGNLPQDLRDYISTGIVEAQPAIAYARAYPIPAIIFIVPVAAALFLGGSLWLRERDPVLGMLMVFCIFGGAVIFYQMRTVIMVASVIPMIGGIVIARMLTAYLAERDAARGLTTILVAVMFIAPTVFVQILRPILPKTEITSEAAAECRSYASLQSLNAIAPGVIFAHGNFGGPLIWATHHDALGAPYHRSAAGLTNGTLVFQFDEPEFRAHVANTSAEYLLLCRGHVYESAFLTGIASGEEADWLQRLPLDNEDQMLFTIIPE